MKQIHKISADLTSKILTVGPDCRNHRGGVGAVIEVYSQYFGKFNFIPSYKVGSTVYKTGVFILGLFKLCCTLVTNREIVIIHIHGTSYGSFYRKFIIFTIGKYVFRKKIIYHIHGGGYNKFYDKADFISKRLIKKLLSQSDFVVCVSRSWYEYYKQNFNFKAIGILPNIIDYPTILAETSKKEYITFLFLGLICNEKGIFDLITIIVKNKERYRGKIKLLIGGNGETHRLLDLIETYQINDIVEFLGWITKEEKVYAFNKSDVYILPSYHEGLPISILEAMSYGRAIISTNVGGIPEIVRNKENGLIIDPGNLEQLEQALDYLLNNPEEIKKYGVASQQFVQNYLPDSVLGELCDIYKTVLLNE